MIPKFTEGFEEKVKEQDAEMVEKIKEAIQVDRESADERVAEKRNAIEEGCSEEQEEEH